MTAPALNFAGHVAEFLARRTAVDLYTVVRSSEPHRIAVGAKVVCPEGEAPRLFDVHGADSRALVALLPKTDKDRWTGLKSLVSASGQTIWLYSERVHPPLQCIVAGAGHIGRELARLADTLGWSVVVADDRSDFAAAEWYPSGVRVLCTPFPRLFEEVRPDQATAVVLVTRGHRQDEELLRRLAGGEAFYVGMIGSRRRVLKVLGQLREEGVDPAWLQKLYAPIGLPIGADTPAEIALAVAAEIMAVWKGRGDWARSEKEAYYKT